MLIKLNVRLLLYLTGFVLLIESGFMFPCIIVSLVDGQKDLVPFAVSFLMTAGVGALGYFSFRNRVNKTPTVKEGFLLVSLAWIVVSATGTLPYVMSGAIPSFVNAYFESVSGFTTTGASILTDIEGLSKANLFWRSLTHWMGGIGIILMVVVILPSLKAGGVHLFSAESTKATYEQLRPRVIDSAKRFGIIYLLLTFAETLLLVAGRMPLFDSFCHAFGTIATGGFSPYNDSLFSVSPYVQYVVVIFMFLSGVNFTLYFLVSRGNIREVFKNEELRTYFFIILFITAVITVLLLWSGLGVHKAFRDSLFQVVSIITCTGFGTTDYLLWPRAAWMLIFLAMFVGACAGSTGGGIKVIRHVLMFKNIKVRIRALLHPQTVYAVRYQGRSLSAENMHSVVAFYFWYLLIFIMASLLMVLLGSGFDTAVGSVASTLGGIGPGLGVTGPAGNYSTLNVVAKILLTFTMIIGRLELYAFLVLFSPAFWKK
jgi:trk system potassium uptake protein TrkH